MTVMVHSTFVVLFFSVTSALPLPIPVSTTESASLETLMTSGLLEIQVTLSRSKGQSVNAFFSNATQMES